MALSFRKRYKLTDEQETQFEDLLNAEEDLMPRPTGVNVGSIMIFEGSINIFST